ncbi:MAG: nucleotidyltransferase domain-containing protein [Deltaproteobacteria bacterium]|nr:nucleotidyltransferase domain-containing protein [Deltaproteobacteria bacterium]
MKDPLPRVLGELRERLTSLYGDRLVRLVLYGSAARGDYDPQGSDIDVLVVLKGPVDGGEEIDRTSFIVADLSLEHDVVIACVFMDQERFLHRQGPFLRNVRREGIRL